MKSTKDITNILNTLSYIELLPKQEIYDEVFKIIHHIKNINNDKRFSGNYKKLWNKVDDLLIAYGYYNYYNYALVLFNFEQKYFNKRLYKSLLITLFLYNKQKLCSSHLKGQ